MIGVAVVVRVLQVSDIHAVRAAGGLAYGHDSEGNLRRVLAAGALQAGPFDVVLATGDIADDASPEAYRRVRDALGSGGHHVRWVPGNHDDPDRMAAVDPHGCEPLDVGAWRILPVDTRRPGHVDGRVASSALLDLGRQLTQAGNRHCLIALHHPPHSPCITPSCLLVNAERVVETLTAGPSVRAVVSGHLHQGFAFHRNDVWWIGAPSTCFQVSHPDHTPTTQPPAAHVLELHADGSLAVSTASAGREPR